MVKNASDCCPAPLSRINPVKVTMNAIAPARSDCCKFPLIDPPRSSPDILQDVGTNIHGIGEQKALLAASSCAIATSSVRQEDNVVADDSVDYLIDVLVVRAAHKKVNARSLRVGRLENVLTEVIQQEGARRCSIEFHS